MKDKMPVWARLIAALFGLLLLPGGVMMLWTVRPLDWIILASSLGAIITGTGFMMAAIWGDWMGVDD